MNYDIINEALEYSFDKRILPFTVGTPSDKLSENDQYDRVNILFFSDSHLDLPCGEACEENVKRTVEYINNAPYKIDAVIYGGDTITKDGIVPKEEAKEYHKKFFDTVKKSERPFLFVKGNHDTNDWKNIPENVVTDQEFSEMFLEFAEEKYSLRRENSTWHYYDIEDKKIRVVAVDIHDVDKTISDENGFVKYHGVAISNIGPKQFDFIINKALNFDDKEEKDWGVIFVMHQYTPNDKGNSPKVFLDICKAFNERTTFEYKNACVEKDFDLDIKADFKDNKADIICCLIGHEHEDRYECINGIHLIWTRNHSGSQLWSDPFTARYKDTVTQNCFDVVNIDTLHRKIRVFRFGAGITCKGTGGDRFLPDGLEY